MIDIVVYTINNGWKEVYPKNPGRDFLNDYGIDPRTFVDEAFRRYNYSTYIEYYEKRFIEFITYKDNVALYYFFRPTKGSRQNDGFGGVIVIPSDSGISGRELSDVIMKMREQLNTGKVNNEELDNIKRDYGLRTKEMCSDSWNNSKYAFHEYSDYDQIRDNLFSPCYRSYKAVFIVNESSQFLTNTVEEIDDETIRNYNENTTQKNEDIKKDPKNSKLQLYCLMLLLLLCFSTLGFFIGRATMKEKYENEVSKIKSSHQQEINALNDSVNNLKGINRNLSEKIINLGNISDEIAKKDEIIESLKTKINQKNKEIKQLKDNNRILKNTLDVNNVKIPEFN